MKKYHKVNHTLLGGKTWPEMYWFIVHWYYSRHILSHEVFFCFTCMFLRFFLQFVNTQLLVNAFTFRLRCTQILQYRFAFYVHRTFKCAMPICCCCISIFYIYELFVCIIMTCFYRIMNSLCFLNRMFLCFAWHYPTQ